MKVRKRSVALDMLSVEENDRLIIISTHRKFIHLTAYKFHGKHVVETHEFTFDQLFSLITKLRPGIEHDV